MLDALAEEPPVNLADGGVIRAGFHAELDELRAFCPQVEADVFAVLTVEGSLASRNHIGGTAPEQVKAAIARARRAPTSRSTGAPRRISWRPET